MVSKHQMDWRTATLEDVEKFRIQVCRELSLYEFSLNLVKVAKGCVEVTWRVPRSLVTYIQNSVKPSSQSMMEHHVATLTIDGFIVYDSSFDEVVPYLLHRRLLTQIQAAEVREETSPVEKGRFIVQAIMDYDRNLAGRLPTLCEALNCAGQRHIAGKLLNKFQSLLKGEAVSHQQEEDEVMISGDSSTQPSPPPDSHLVTAQLEGSLTRAQYNTIHSLTSSLLQRFLFIAEMAQGGIDKNPRGRDGENIPQLNEISLFHAAWDGDLERLNGALQKGIPVDFVSPDGGSSLVYASKNGHVEVVDKLLQHGATVDMHDEGGWSSLVAASLGGHVEVVDKLLEHGATVDLQSKDGASSLMVASLNGHVEAVDKLLQHGATVDLQSKDGVSSLMAASLQGHVEVVDKLLQHGATIDLHDEDGASSLMIASLNGHVEAVDKLLQHGATVDLQSKDGVSSLMAASLQGHVEVVDKLLQHGATVDLQDKDDDTALTFACGGNDFSAVSILLKAGAHPNVCNKAGQTPLLLAVWKNNMAIVRELVNARVDVDHMYQNGLSSLMLCCENGNSEMANLLLEAQADADLQQSGTGYIALMFACKGGHLDTVIGLMEHGANSAIKNQEGMTALDVASVNGFQHLCAVINLMGPPPTVMQDEIIEHPDTPLMKEAVDEVIKRFHAQMDHVPLISLYDNDKQVELRVPKQHIKRHIKLFNLN
ncbi:Ankyrin repeat domain-containing protein 50 [Geodia barretti]|uniref:Ankyrin repeat domain-containing protein 50 n=1 Tax=Geodia barretti TaxID=519541 RepID=A0AA35R8P1_GEOBA|nr:Ankyrin repeat domain-containing protein 50 [Geodia barretti]